MARWPHRCAGRRVANNPELATPSRLSTKSEPRQPSSPPLGIGGGGGIRIEQRCVWSHSSPHPPLLCTKSAL